MPGVSSNPQSVGVNKFIRKRSKGSCVGTILHNTYCGQRVPINDNWLHLIGPKTDETVTAVDPTKFVRRQKTRTTHRSDLFRPGSRERILQQNSRRETFWLRCQADLALLPVKRRTWRGLLSIFCLTIDALSVLCCPVFLFLLFFVFRRGERQKSSRRQARHFTLRNSTCVYRGGLVGRSGIQTPPVWRNTERIK